MNICHARNNVTNKLLNQVFRAGGLINLVDKAIWVKVGNIVTYEILKGLLGELAENDFKTL